MKTDKQIKARRFMTAKEYLQIAKDEAAEAVAKIIGRFDFEKATASLRAVDWKYFGAAESPTALELETIALDCVRRAIEYGSRSSVQSGPLLVITGHYDTPAVVNATLYLVPLSSGAVYVDGRVLIAKKQIGLLTEKSS